MTSSILVIDENDGLKETHEVNALHDPESGVMVMHAPRDPAAAPAELLRALSVRHSARKPPSTSREKVLAQAWLSADSGSTLVVYGAWRAAEGEYAAWLDKSAAIAGVSLIFYSNVAASTANNRLKQIAATQWSRELLHATFRKRTSRSTRAGRDDEFLDGLSDEILPWPYVLAALDRGLSDRQYARAHDLFQRGVEIRSYHGAALAVQDVLGRESTPEGRNLALALVTQGAFDHGRLWVDFDRSILGMAAHHKARREDWTCSEPLAYIEQYVLDQRGYVEAVTVDGREVHFSSAPPIQLPARDRRAARALRHLLTQGHTVVGPRDDQRYGWPVSAQSQHVNLALWGRCRLHSLGDGQFESSPYRRSDLPGTVAPLQLDIPHAAVLNGLRERQAKLGTPATAFALRDFDRVVDDLARGGLVELDNRGFVVPTRWLRHTLQAARLGLAVNFDNRKAWQAEVTDSEI